MISTFTVRGRRRGNIGSDLVQYVLSPLIGKVYALFQRRRPNDFWESWHYPGLVILAAAGAVIVARLRGRALGGADPRLLERLVMLAAILVVLSLAGGPSVLLFLAAPSFRCYGRAGMLAVAVASVVTPAILAAWSDRWRSARLRAAFFGGALALALVDGGAHVRVRLHEAEASVEADPPWVDWLAKEALGRSACGLPGAPRPQGLGMLPSIVGIGTASTTGCGTVTRHSTAPSSPCSSLISSGGAPRSTK